MYKSLVRPFLFLFNAESVHKMVNSTVHWGFKVPFARKIATEIFRYDGTSLSREVFGIKFPNPIGLAAGFDKNGRLYNDMAAFGFGFVEIGTLTPRPQSGNPKPRLFRLVEDEAIINRMGFNNDGVAGAVEYLKKHRPRIIIGGNIGKNKSTPNEEAVADYIACFDALYSYVDYFTINISSPNTPGLRKLQEKEPLKKLLRALIERNEAKPGKKPLLLKISPDVELSQLDELVDIALELKLDGVVATNTTIAREGLRSNGKVMEQAGGLSGKPMKDKSTATIRHIAARSDGKLPIIGVGGVHSPEDAMEKFKAGASLVQLYTGFIYEGPGLVKKIKRRLAENHV